MALRSEHLHECIVTIMNKRPSRVRTQSPLNIIKSTVIRTEDGRVPVNRLVISYALANESNLKIYNNGHTLQVDKRFEPVFG
jgi:hypothetical protein